MIHYVEHHLPLATERSEKLPHLKPKELEVDGSLTDDEVRMGGGKHGWEWGQVISMGGRDRLDAVRPREWWWTYCT